jgi:hypothetical protein
MEKLQEMINQKVQDALKKFQDTTSKKTWEDTETTKWTHRELQQTPMWNKGNYKKRDIWSKGGNTNMKEELKKYMENLRKKNQT